MFSHVASPQPAMLTPAYLARTPATCMHALHALASLHCFTEARQVKAHLAVSRADPDGKLMHGGINCCDCALMTLERWSMVCAGLAVALPGDLRHAAAGRAVFALHGRCGLCRLGQRAHDRSAHQSSSELNVSYSTL